MKKILIVGGSGFVGGNLCKNAQANGYTPVVCDVMDNAVYENIEYHKCNITDYSSVLEVFKKVMPDLVVNVAAIADIDKAENNKLLAFDVNVTGAKNCAAAAKETGAKYVWFSSDAIFSGEDEKGYDETSEPNPKNYYGETKELGEEEVLKANSNAIVLRISLVIGFSVAGGNSFVNGLYNKLSSGQKVSATVNEVRTPIEVNTLCNAIYELANLDFSGIINIGSTDSVNRYTLTKMLACELGFAEEMVEPTDVVDKTRAPRHKYGVISVDKAKNILKNTRLLSVSESVKKVALNK